MNIKINNWQEYQPRNDLKSMRWFRLENDLPFNQKFFELSVYSKWFFVFILCLCAKKTTDHIDYNKKYFATMSGVPEKEIDNVISSLEQVGLLTLIRNEPVTETCLHNITEHNNTRQNMSTYSCPEQTSCSRPSKIKITYNQEKSIFENIAENDLDLWASAYPAINLNAELNSMCAWLKANPKNLKSNYERFIISWLKRSQDKARRV